MIGNVPENEAWRMRVDVEREKESQRPVFTLDDLRNVAGWANSFNKNLMTPLIDETIGLLHDAKIWNAVMTISELIPDIDYVQVSRRQLREALQKVLPREW